MTTPTLPNVKCGIYIRCKTEHDSLAGSLLLLAGPFNTVFSLFIINAQASSLGKIG